VKLPILPPYPPMEAKQVDAIPRGEQWSYEPKWDGFRCIAFRDGDDIELQSKSCKPLARYFPDVADALRALGAQKFVLDGELVIPHAGSLSFEALLMRIHPAASRVKKLASETPALFVAFDLLVPERGDPLVDSPFAERRDRLESFAAKYFTTDQRLSPHSSDYDQATKWLSAHHGGLDGVIAKRNDLPYRTGERDGMQKIKRYRSADCVVAGLRWSGTGTKTIGSLLLGLYDENGLLHHVGYTSSMAKDLKQQVTEHVRPYIGGSGFSGRAPGGPSRWATEKSGEWEPLDPALVVEVRYDHFSEGRFRHGTTFMRWRPDKEPEQCRFEALESEGKTSLNLLKKELNDR
jgi:ATP-dependent DNA ligase